MGELLLSPDALLLESRLSRASLTSKALSSCIYRLYSEYRLQYKTYVISEPISSSRANPYWELEAHYPQRMKLYT